MIRTDEELRIATTVYRMLDATPSAPDIALRDSP
jgi:hypothetical protein